ncbi:MAG: alpha/beta hydrolase domain-containing protein [Desulfobacterales bacterium]
MSVIDFEILSRKPYAEGESFGTTGAYEQIDGKVTFAVDPLHPANEGIVDLQLAPPDEKGRVRFVSDISILAPLDLKKGSDKLLVDSPNRGGCLASSTFNRNLVLLPEDRLKPGDGWLLRSGYTVAAIGWQWDLTFEGSLSLEAPEARVDDRPVKGQAILEYRPGGDGQYWGIRPVGQKEPVYPVFDLDSDENCLYVRDYEDGPVQLIPFSRWRFGKKSGDDILPDPNYIYLEDGFKKGKIYHITYTTEGAPVVGVGLLAVREIATFLRHRDPLSPLSAGYNHVYGFGVSQTGRLLRHFLHLGLNRDESGRVAYDGLLIHIAGGQRGDFNHRFAEPGQLLTPSFGQQFPFAATQTEDPFSEVRDNLIGKLEQIDAVPKVFMINTSWEYWRGDASLAHTQPDGSADLPEHARIRTYHIAGTHHLGGILIKGKQIFELPMMGIQTVQGLNVVGFAPLVRAALSNLDQWVSEGVDPPLSRYPELSKETAVTRKQVLEQFKKLRSVPLLDPGKLSVLRRLDLGPEAAGGVGRFPAKELEAYPCFVSAIDDDFNEVAGIRMPDISVPVGSHTGWNARSADMGAPDLAAGFLGFTLFFPRNRAEREDSRDPRMSIEERYQDRDDYLRRVGQATDELIADRYVLVADRQWVVDACATRYDAAMAVSPSD